MLRQIMIYY